MSDLLAPQAIWSDSHCHLHDEAEPGVLLQRAHEHGVARIVLVGTDEDSSARALAVAQVLGEGVFATVGLHPHEATSGTAFLTDLLNGSHYDEHPHPSTSVVAIGECGLDYYYEHSPRDAQRTAFVEQIALAKSTGLALVVHTRDAWEDTLSILKNEGAPERTVIHCFTGGVDEARACLELGAYLSFSGILTFKNASGIRDAAAFCPLDRMLVETDAPYLAPVPHRGTRNEPAYVTVVGDALASLRHMDVVELAQTTSENTSRAFDLVA